MQFEGSHNSVTPPFSGEFKMDLFVVRRGATLLIIPGVGQLHMGMAKGMQLLDASCPRAVTELERFCEDGEVFYNVTYVFSPSSLSLPSSSSSSLIALNYSLSGCPRPLSLCLPSTTLSLSAIN
jgi:hypothetical protein